MKESLPDLQVQLRRESVALQAAPGNPVESRERVMRGHGSFIAGSFQCEQAGRGEIDPLTLITAPGGHDHVAGGAVSLRTGLRQRKFIRIDPPVN